VTRVFSNLTALKAAVGTDLGHSAWLEIAHVLATAWPLRDSAVQSRWVEVTMLAGGADRIVVGLNRIQDCHRCARRRGRT
jgi:hypothetical protein